ncbi:MAG: methyltransferase domain-containing protein [Acidimicrobiales bacterium]
MRPVLEQALACPQCHQPISAGDLHCGQCDLTFPVLDGIPALLVPDHPMLKEAQSRDRKTNGKGAGGIRQRMWAARPEDRMWSGASRRAVSRALVEAEADDPKRLVVNLGAGVERIFVDSLTGKAAVSRVGLPHIGTVDLFGDVMQFPLRDGSVDLFLSSSVMEHVTDPELGIAEMSRVIRPGGLVYAEIPFIRSYHMEPQDFQRYTISGIEALFARHDFELVDKGVCSGPFTAIALIIGDMANAFLKGRYSSLLVPMVYWLVHPLKYLDRLVEGRSAAEFQACNFYYLGRRI